MIETPHLQLRPLKPDDAAFILKLLNQPSWLRFIGDKGIKTLDDARDYILQGPMLSEAQRGFSLYRVSLKNGDVPIGICGLVCRETLPDADLGFALLPEYCGRGYAHEAALATLDHARHVLKLKRLLAITLTANRASINLLRKLDMRFERMISLKQNATPLELYSIDWQ